VSHRNLSRRSLLLAPSLLSGRSQLRQALQEAPLGDTHEHLYSEKHRLSTHIDIFTLLAQYTISDLTSAGLDGKARAQLSNPEISIAERWRLAAPYWEKARNTGFARAFEIALRDIYGAPELNEKTCEQISARIVAANRQGFTDRMLREKCRIRFAVVDDYYNTDPVKPDSPLYLSARRFDRFVSLTSKDALQKLEAVTRSSIHSLADLERGLQSDFERNLKLAGMAVIKIGQAYLRPLYFRQVARRDAEREFEQVAGGELPAESPSRFEQLTQVRAKSLQDYMLHRVIQLAREHKIPVQVHTGLHAGNRNYIPNSNPAHLINLFFEYPDVTFDLFHSGYPYLSEMAAIAKSFPNVYIDLTWIYIISPSASQRALHEYLDTVPASKILGFGGDYHYAEMTYGHSVMAREIIIRVLEQKVADRYFTEPHAIAVGRRLLHDNAAEVFGWRQAPGVSQAG